MSAAEEPRGSGGSGLKFPRIGLLAPLFGLILLLSALVARALRGEGLGLGELPPPAPVAVEAFDLPLGGSHLRGSVVDELGRPVAEALVLLVEAGEPIWAHTDAEGRFELHGLPAGPHLLRVHSRLHHALEVEASAPADGLRLALERPFEPIPILDPLRRGALRGRLEPALEGASTAGYELLLSPLLRPDSMPAAVERRTRTGADGRFAIEDLLSGEYRLVVLPPWARGGTWPDLVAPEASLLVHGGGASGELSVRLAAGELAGRALDEQGQPIEGALALLRPSAASERPFPPQASDSGGGFRLRDLPPGEYELELSAGEARVSLTVLVEPGRISTPILPRLMTRGSEDS